MVNLTRKAKGREPNSPTLEQAESEAARMGESLRRSRRERLKPEQARAETVRRKAKEQTASLHGLPAHILRGDLNDISRLIMGRRELATKLKPLMEASAREAFGRWKKNRPSLSLSFGVEELEELDMRIVDGVIQGAPSSEKLMAVVRRRLGAADLFSIAEKSRPSLDMLERKYLSPDASSTRKTER